MAKRHQFGADFVSRIKRLQEIIMANSGVDEFYEIIRLILAKYFAEGEGYEDLPDKRKCDLLLREHGAEVAFILDGALEIQTPDSIFKEVRRIFGSTNITGQDFTALDQAFEQLTSRSYKSEKGQYFTPRHVIDMCVEAVDPKPGELICDPACGSAAFLKSAHTHTLKNYGETAKLYGFDYSHRACQVAKVVSLIGARGEIKVEQMDSLRLPAPTLLDEEQETIEHMMGPSFEGFDVIVTNPPFAGDISVEGYANGYDVARTSSKRLERDVLFIERCIRLLKVGGRLAIVLPDNKVSGKAFRAVRLWLGKNSEIKAVVSLHRYTFLPYTSQKAAVIFAVKRQPALSPYESEITFFRSDAAGKASNGTPVYRDNADVDHPAYIALDHDLDEIAPQIRSVICAA
ncbi:HsdM family class I SAM-dependent methyltransferase [Novosphingobium lindaniclasticum]|uniref:HsdM family class I SAM-dependent methyltransferase n=1 Tax=Novosphingobium lindaniclasticum TaxID=1329895 RepID=UPI0009DB8F7C|nr:N-6 DNA methylase [Novosphingobium lindaniclasticum]